MKSRFFKNPCRCVNQIGKPELRYQRKQKQININVQASRSQRAYGIRQYLGIQYSMSEERKTELLRNFVGWFLDHQTSDEGLFRDLHVEIGMTKKELHDYGIDIDKQFEQAEKEVTDLHQRTKEGIETARLQGKQIGLAKGTKLTTKKSISTKEKILKYSKDFQGTLNDSDCIQLLGIARNTYYKYKRELKEA